MSSTMYAIGRSVIEICVICSLLSVNIRAVYMVILWGYLFGITGIRCTMHVRERKDNLY